MYVTPVRFQQFTNREDFLTTCAIMDDVTGNPINLSGTVLANPGVPFTSNNWKVTVGNSVLTSTTPLTIPVPPINAELVAVTLTVPPNLNLAPGLPVTIADSATGNNQMLGYVTSYTNSIGTLVCQIGFTFQFEIRGDMPTGSSAGYRPYWDWGSPNDQGAILLASLGNGISIIDVGYLQIFIPESNFRSILDQPYNSQTNTFACTFKASMTMTDTINTRQLFVGRLPVLFGGVTL